MPVIHRYAVYAGVASAILFYMVATGIITGIFIPFTPLVPLFWAGFRFGGHAVTHSALVALLGCLMVLGPAVASSLLLYFIAPAWVLGRQLLKARLTKQGGIEWFASGNAVTALVSYMAIAFILVGYALAGEENDLLRVLQTSSKEVMASMNMEPQVAAPLKRLAAEHPYLIFAIILWFSSLVTYAAAWLANAICISYSRSLRTTIAITPYDPPVYVLVWLIISGLLGFFVTYETAYIMQTVFLLFLLPYFLLGVALMHEKSQGWEGRRFWLGMIYLLMLLSHWPAVLLSGWGVFRHISRLSAMMEDRKP